MGIVVRPANLDSDREVLIDTLGRYLTALSDGRRFDWLYRDNPHGPARVWIATDTESHAVVGLAAAFPRRLYVGEAVKLGCVLGDFCIHERYRSLGPALQLQRACLAEIDSGPFELCYDFPSKSMMAVYRRLGVEPRERLVRLAKPLRANREIPKRVKVQVVARGLSALTNLLLALRDFRFVDGRNWASSVHEGLCGEEFSALARQIGSRYGVCIQRSAEYLNWRYLAHPLRRHEMLTARVQGALVAYAVFTQTGEDAALVDLFGTNDLEILKGLVADVVAILRKRGVVTVSAPLLASHPWVALLCRLGFRAREESPVVTYGPARPSATQSMVESHKWFLMQGDRES